MENNREWISIHDVNNLEITDPKFKQYYLSLSNAKTEQELKPFLDDYLKNEPFREDAVKLLKILGPSMIGLLKFANL